MEQQTAAIVQASDPKAAVSTFGASAVNDPTPVIAEKLSAAAGYGGSGTAFVFGLSPSEWSVLGVIGGLVIGLAGFLVNAYFGWRRLQLDERRAQG